MKLKTQLIAVAAVLTLGAAGNAMAAATIINSASTLALGVNSLGHLNTEVGSVAVNSSRTGIAYNFGTASAPEFRDATSPGCFCEGWGVSASGVSGFANEVAGTAGLTLTSFTNTASTATSIVTLSSMPLLTVKQEYFAATAAPGALFQNRVTITNNTGDEVTDLRYVRVMDWDVPRTEFNEFVTIRGTVTATALEKSHLDGFASSDPLDTSCDATGCGFGGVDVDVTDAGPADHGAYFRFNFGPLADGASYSFDIFYGATGSEASALAAISAAGMELYSLGQSNRPSGDPVLGTPATFIFGFKGVGGVVLEPVSAPGTLALASLALLGVGAASRRRKA